MDENTTNTTAAAEQQAGQNTDGENAAAGATQSASAGENSANGEQTKIEDIIQRAVDRATNKLGNENKKLRAQIDELKKAKLSDDEIKQMEMKEKDAELTEREQQLRTQENRWIASNAIREAGLDDGSPDSRGLIDFVMADDEDGIKERVNTFSKLVQRFVKAEVDRVFKSNGRNPGVGNSADSKGENKSNNLAVALGKNAAKANEAAKSTLDYYIGGGKK